MAKLSEEQTAFLIQLAFMLGKEGYEYLRSLQSQGITVPEYNELQVQAAALNAKIVAAKPKAKSQ